MPHKFVKIVEVFAVTRAAAFRLAALTRDTAAEAGVERVEQILN
jgi:hypothetical protein